MEALVPRFIIVKAEMCILRDSPHIYFSANSDSPTTIWWPDSGFATSFLRGLYRRMLFCSTGTWVLISDCEVFWNVSLKADKQPGKGKYNINTEKANQTNK